MMANIYTSAEQLIGRTPILELTHIEREYKLSARILGKMECWNLAGSVKDRIAKSMIEDAEASGRLKPGATIIEPTSGNEGIALAAVAAVKGYRIILVMPETMSVERRQMMVAYGARLELTVGSKGMQGAISRARALAEEIDNSFLPDQFQNPSNPRVHREETGPEIFADTDGKVDIFVAGVGTGGTLTGVGEYLKKRNPKIQIVAVEPADSPVLSKGRAGEHQLQGIGPGFVPRVLNRRLIDEVITATAQDATAICRQVGRSEGILMGISSGAAVWAAIQLARRRENAGKTIVTILADSGERYLSTLLYMG